MTATRRAFIEDLRKGHGPAAFPAPPRSRDSDDLQGSLRCNRLARDDIKTEAHCLRFDCGKRTYFEDDFPYTMETLRLCRLLDEAEHMLGQRQFVHLRRSALLVLDAETDLQRHLEMSYLAINHMPGGFHHLEPGNMANALRAGFDCIANGVINPLF